MQVLFFCLAIPGLAALLLVLYSCVLGTQAFNSARHVYGEQAATLRFLALNLCEPIAGIPLTLLTLYLLGNTWIERLPFGFLLIWPMWALLIPGRGLRFQTPIYRQANTYIFGLGALRMLLNGLCFSMPAITKHIQSDILLPFVMIVLPIGSIGTLAYTVFWARRQLNGTLATPLVAAPIGPNTASVAAARPATIVNPEPVAAPQPLHYHNATPCPVCAGLIPFKASACPHCGLVAASRIPEVLRDLPRYTVLRPLGQGGMSHIYLAEDRASATICIIKAVVSAESSDAHWQYEARRCLEREAMMLRDVQHPGIVTLLGWYPEAIAPFIALEYVAGPSLEQRLEHGAVSIGEALRYAATTAESIAFLAGLKHPIVHCDIKPGNLIVTETNAAAVLVDFGSAIMLDTPMPETHSDHYGTPGYAAPEQYRHHATPKSDVYGLAATLYHLLTGDDPTKHPLAFPSLWLIPGEISAALIPALEQDPQLRPTPAEFSEILHGLAQAYR